MRQFRFTTGQQRALQRGRPIQCYGEVRAGPSSLEMVHPEYRLLQDEDSVPTENSLTSVYPTTDGVGQRKWRDLARKALDSVGQDVEELLPPDTDIPGGNISLAEALEYADMKPEADQARLAVHYTSALKNK